MTLADMIQVPATAMSGTAYIIDGTWSGSRESSFVSQPTLLPLSPGSYTGRLAPVHPG